MKDPFKVAVIQMNSQTQLDGNLQQAYDLLKEASEKGAVVAGLPENFAFLGGLEMRMEKAEEISERISPFLSSTAQELGMYIMGGSYPIPTADGKVYNHSILYGPEGRKRASYDKIHLFDVSVGKQTYRESAYVNPGKPEPVSFKDDIIGGWGLSICYDIRFPELYRKLAEQGADVLSIPSAFTYTTGQDHWKTLLKARAIENTCYVFAPAQTGLHGKNRRTWGHSMIIDPWGEVVADVGEEPGVAIGEINPERLRAVRQSIPSLKHRRL